jgi:leucyl aminopeptidase (aminopeptidase T)
MMRATDNGQRALAAAVALDRLAVSAGDKFCVVYNHEFAAIAAALAEAAATRTADIRMEEAPPTSRNGEEPPAAVAAAMQKATAVVLLTRFSLSHTQARLRASRAGARIASLPGITEEVFARTLPVDYGQLERVGRALAAKLSEATLCHVTAPGGTDVELELQGREATCDDGDLRAAGAFGNLPAGEAYIAPLERSGRGTIVFDGSLAGWGPLDEPLAIELEQGRAVIARGGSAAEWLLETLEAGGANGRTLGELGIGTNPGATISGLILEDEKAEGTIHLAFGTNTGFGGDNQASVHIDGLVRDASVELDGLALLREGRLFN